MTDLDGKQEEKKEQEPTETDPAAEPKKTETNENSPGPVPYDRFKEVNDKAKGYEARLAELEKLNVARESADEKARTDRLKEQEKFQELATEWETKATGLQPKLEAAESELEQLRGIVGKYAEAQIEAVPELFREVVGKMPVIEQLEWFTANASKLGKNGPQGIPATPKGSGVGEMSNDDRRRRSARTF